MSKGNKRQHGDGTFRRLKNGSFEYTISLGTDVYGERLRKSFYGANKAECRRKAREFLKGVGQEKVVATDYTLGEWANRWLKSYRGTGKQAQTSTLEEYKYLSEFITSHKISKVKLIDIKPIMVDDFFNEALSNYSHSTNKKVRFVLNAVFESAIENDLCYKNPVKKVAIPIKKPNKKTPFTDEEKEVIIEFAKTDELFGLAMIILLETGIRSGELRALQPSAFNFEDGYVLIDKAVKKTGELGFPKNGKSRIIPIREVILKHIENNIDLSAKYVVSGDYYTSESGIRSRYLCFFRRLNEQRKDSNLKPIPSYSPHICRHTYSTTLQRKGVPMTIVSTLLGHSSLEVTEGYTHLSALQDLKNAIEKANES